MRHTALPTGRVALLIKTVMPEMDTTHWHDLPFPEDIDGCPARPRVLVVTRTYLPGSRSGGPIKSISNMVEMLSGLFRFAVLCEDRDLGAAAPYDGVQHGRWRQVGKVRVRYLSGDESGPLGVLHAIRATRSDIVYLNSFFQPRFGVLPMWAKRCGFLGDRPLLVAPRGEFNPGAMRRRSFLKKRVYLALARGVRLASGVSWQATNTEEADEIATNCGAPFERIHVAGNIAVLRAPETAIARSAPGPLRIVFLSRIVPKKNLDFAIRSVLLMKSPVRFDIYGPIEDPGYWSECEALLADAPSHVRVTYRGEAPMEQVADIYGTSDVLLLPTHGENFGHAIVEALAAGVTVVLSDQTPWRDLERAGVGYDLPLAQPDRFVAALDREAARSPEERSARRAVARRFAEAATSHQATVAAAAEMFTQACAGGRSDR